MGEICVERVKYAPCFVERVGYFFAARVTDFTVFVVGVISLILVVSSYGDAFIPYCPFFSFRH
jgi:hypothetical protein